MRVLVTGAKGMMGRDLCRELRGQGHEVIETDLPELDVRVREQAHKVFADTKPELAFHLAALTDVDGCEQRPDEAYYTNAVGTQVVALECQALDIPMVYISTLSVFDGTSPVPYTEFDDPNPPNLYARSKLAGERIVQQLLNRFYILRAGWMFGGGPEDKKFIAKIVELARSKPELSIVDDKFGCPTYTKDFSRLAIRLSGTGWYGLYHGVNTGGPVSRYECAQKILEYAGVTSCRLVPVSTAKFPLPAARPRMEGGRNTMLELRGCQWMRPWDQALKDYIETVLLGRS